MTQEQLRALQMMVTRLLKKYSRERKMNKAEFKAMVLVSLNETIIELTLATEKEPRNANPS